MSYLYLSQFCYVMNKKFIICGAIAAGLLLAACSSKKEEAHPDEQQAQSEQANNPASEQFHSINENSNTPASDVAPPAPPAKKL
jgi:protein involved in sex pheromone biosynthesis